MMTGIMNSTRKLGCALPCEIIGGAKAASAAPSAAAHRLRTSRLAISQYQPAAVAARPPVSTSAQVTVGPNASVTGVSGTESPSMGVLPMRFTPAGKFCAVVKSGLCRWATLSAVTAKNHSHWFWSWSESRR